MFMIRMFARQKDGQGLQLELLGEHHRDVLRRDMAQAISLVFGEEWLLVEQKGNPACAGKIDIRLPWWPKPPSDRWTINLRRVLEDAKWDLDTHKGYGEFIEQLASLRSQLYK